MVIDERWYPVVGETAEHLREGVRLLGPTRGGRVFAAFTDWSVSWRWDASRGRDGHTLVDWAVGLKATVTLPRWIPLRGTADDLIGRWVAFVEALRRHEDGHLNLARAAADGVRSELRVLGPRTDREALGRAVEHAARTAVARARAAERAYDAITRDGAEQGASIDMIRPRELGGDGTRE